MYRAPTMTNSKTGHNVLCPYKDADHHRSMEAGRLALPDVLSARAGNRLGGIFLGHGLPANGTIFAPHVNTCFYSTDLTAFPSTNLAAFSLTNLMLQCRRAGRADRTLRRILRAVAVL